MAKKEKAVYAPGELSRVREKLGTLNENEARQMVEKLGGEVGYERTEEQEKIRQNPQQQTRHERVEVKIGDRPGGRPRRSVELAPDAENESLAKSKARRRKGLSPDDDPSVPQKASYWDRIKLDKFAGQSEFEIKSSGQVLHSMVALFTDIPDHVNPVFVKRRMPAYYKQIEYLVLSTRTLFPRNNARRNERMKKSAPLVYTILDVLRYWNIEKISGELARIQGHPRKARVNDFAEILRAVYRPLFVLDQLDSDIHIRGAYKILYKLLYIENPTEAQGKYQGLIRTALAAFFEIRREIHYLLYPLLMKTISARYIPYDRFFVEQKNRFMAFLNVTDDDQINPAAILMQPETKEEKPAGEKPQEETSPEQEQPEKEGEAKEEKKEEISEEEKARRAEAEAERKAVEKGLQTLEVLFPEAGWDQLSSYPDLYPYFVDTFDLKKGFVNIAPTDPLQQIFILMRILEELFFGLRYVSFGTVRSPTGGSERVDTAMGEIINNWRYFTEISFEKEYLPRMNEYIRILEGSVEERSSAYTKKLVAELHWIKRLYFLPYYKFETLVPPPLQKSEVKSIYSKIKSLRRYLSAVAAGIEQGARAGGAEVFAPCEGIDNPWEPYEFQVPNPLSIRLDALLTQKNRNNASLIFFCLAVTTVLDTLVNSEDSWAYNSRQGPLFRSVNGTGVTPLTGVDTKIDAKALFKQSLKQRTKNAGPGINEQK